MPRYPTIGNVMYFSFQSIVRQSTTIVTDANLLTVD